MTKTVEQALAEATAAATAKAKELADSALIATYSDPTFVNIMANVKAKEASLNRLAKLDKICEETVAQMPIYSNKTRQMSQWKPRSQFGLSTEVSKLVGLVTGIQYSKAEHKVIMLEATGLSETVCEDLLSALGSLPYFNETHGVVVDGIQPNVPALKQSLRLAAATIGITLDLSFMTETFMARRFEAAMIRAQSDSLARQKAVLTEENKVII